MTDAPFVSVNTHPEGYVLRLDGQAVEVFPTLSGASIARHTAREALAMLAACLASPSSTERKAA